MKKSFHKACICGILLGVLFLAAGISFQASTVETQAAVKNGFSTVSGKTYYYKNGVKQTGLVTVNGKTYYFRSSDGARITGWVKFSSGKYRYFNKSTGVMTTGLVKIGTKKYYFEKSGYAVSGWVTSKYTGNRRYFNTKNFAMATGWKYNESKTKRWYFDKTTGVQYTGLKQVGSKWYNFSGSSYCAKSGWLKDSSGNTRYFKPKTFEMKTGWSISGSKRRYFDTSTGIMYKRLHKISGKYYYFNTKGLAVTGWVNFSGGKRYFSKSTYAMVTGTVEISGITYTFNSKGFLTSSTNYWTQQLITYRKDSSVKQLLFVQYISGTLANVVYYQKNSSGNWTKTFTCEGYIGSNGLNKTSQGDKKTPTGTFTPTMAFGLLSNPGSKLSYTKITNYHYWCGDKKWYNQLIDTRTQSHTCSGEHLIDYSPLYNYAINIGYNKNNVYKKGYGIFLHCVKSGQYYTDGCIAISQTNMKKLVQTMTSTAKIIIREK